MDDGMNIAGSLTQFLELMERQETQRIRQERRELFLRVFEAGAKSAIEAGYAPSKGGEMADAYARKAVELFDEWLEEEDARGG